MRQFEIFRNPDTVSARSRPYIVVLQSDFLSGVGSVVVAPLAPAARVKPLVRLTPKIPVGNSDYVVMMHELAAIPRKVLKRSVGTAASKSDELVAALDLVFVGF